ncbi:MAG TPA: amino acid permease, partial [Saprospiraceae bacterium]|nr:amino acid permease [Saprospiraceae bacterium]
DYSTAHSGFNEVTQALTAGTQVKDILPSLMERYNAWSQCPQFFGLHLIMDVPALCIVILITWIVFRGIHESRNTSNYLVLFKLVVIFFVIVIGGYYVNPDNWSPFAPNGVAGVLKGVSAVFFAYIGFDAISTTAEECEDAQKDLPKGMIYSLIICTILYVILALILTGVVKYNQLNVGDPLAMIFDAKGLKWIAGIVAISAVVATASVLLVFQLGQPRIWMNMSRDGLLPKIFSRIHPIYGTPSFSTILTGFVVAVPALFLNLDIVISLTSIGTLFAFVLVCGGVLVLRQMPDSPKSKFKVPYVNGKYIVPISYLMIILFLLIKMPGYFPSLLSIEGSPMILFFAVISILIVYTYKRSFSLIPVLGVVSCFYLMAQESHTNWWRFLIWLVVGLVIYFSYSKNHSKLGKAS